MNFISEIKIEIKPFLITEKIFFRIKQIKSMHKTDKTNDLVNSETFKNAVIHMLKMQNCINIRSKFVCGFLFV